MKASFKVVEPNYDEALVPKFELPKILNFEDGTLVTQENWGLRREEILNLFRANIYGYAPNLSKKFSVKIVREVEVIGCRGCIRRDLELSFFNDHFKLPVMLFLPEKSKQPAPVFIGLNFQGNHTVHPDPSIDLPNYWVRDRPDLGSNGNRASNSSRGMHSACWPIEMITAHGFALATADFCAVASDNPEHFQSGVHLYGSIDEQKPTAAIATWAWALSRIKEAVASFSEEIDPTKTTTIGHSRLGKTALWAAAEDPTFSMAISIQSGQNGAALGRRCFGERIEHGINSFPYWYHKKFEDFIQKEHELPIDQHQLLALIAPRPLYVASAEEDLWCDPKGEFLACVAANPVYELFGLKGIGMTDMPPSNQCTGDFIGYHIRPGKHSVLPIDWWHILHFVKKHFKGTLE